MLMDLNGFQALKMTVKKIEDVEYLFVEAGGFRENNPPEWRTPLIVMKR